MPGGVGLAARLFERHDELVRGARDLVAACACLTGCPACAGPSLETGGDARAVALRLLTMLGGKPQPSTGSTASSGGMRPRRGDRRAAGRGTCRAPADHESTDEEVVALDVG